MLTDVMRTTFEALGSRLQAFAPNLLAMLLILLVGVVVAGAVHQVLRLLLPLAGLDRFAARTGLRAATSRGGLTRPVSGLLALGVGWIVLVAFVLFAVAALDIRVAVDAVTTAFAWLPHLLVALAVLIAGWLVAAFLRRSVLIAAVNAGVSFARAVAAAARYAVLVLFGAIALEQVGLGTHVVLVAFAILFGGIVLALALAFGLAGRDLARDALLRLVSRHPTEEDDGLHHL